MNHFDDYTGMYGELDAERDAYRRAQGVYDGIETPVTQNQLHTALVAGLDPGTRQPRAGTTSALAAAAG